MLRRIGQYRLAGLLVLLALVLAACAGTSPTPTPAPTATPVPTLQPTAEPMATTEAAHDEGDKGMGMADDGHDEEVELSDEAREGYEIYLSVGCATCHGDKGQGGVGPALAGHTPEQVRRQVRNPVGNMPAFSTEQLSDEDLEKVIAFVQSLGGPNVAHGHDDQGLTPLHVHHLMTLLALQDENLADAIHHLQHTLPLADEAQRDQLTALITMLEEGKAHDVEHELQQILGAMEPEVGTTLVKLQVQLAFQALAENKVDEARHEVEHLVETASGEEKATGEEVMRLLDANDLEGAQAHLQELLGQEGGHAD